MSEHHPDHEYRPDAVEAKWQARWAERGTNEPDLDQAPRPFYNLMMFPYPSAEGLHVGNCFAFTGADVYGRFKRLRGHSVFEPMGFDAFGIHSENFAIKLGIPMYGADPKTFYLGTKSGCSSERGSKRLWQTIQLVCTRKIGTR